MSFGIHLGIHNNSYADLVSEDKNVCNDPAFFWYSKPLVMISPWQLQFMRRYTVNPTARLCYIRFSNLDQAREDNLKWASEKVNSHNSHLWSKEAIMI